MTGRDAVRDQIAAALHRSVCDEIPDGGTTCDELADALLPVVDRIAKERAAEELRAAADWIWDDVPARASASAELHARADALDPS